MDYETLRRCHFHKYSALGNDYLVLDPAGLPAARELAPERVRAICARHDGVGADGVMVGPLWEADGRMSLRIYNPDGSEAEKSGNGIRIFTRYAFEAGYVADQPFQLSTRGGVVTARALAEAASMIAVDMGAPSFRSGDIPMTGPDREVVDEPLTIGGEELRVTCVSMGNPHCVVFGAEVSAENAQRLGPLLERATYFPNRTNVQLARPLSRSLVAMQIWERGAGYTLASGTSSCAVASAARRLGLVDDVVELRMPGGSLSVRFLPDGHALLTGPVAGVAHGYFHSDLLG